MLDYNMLNWPPDETIKAREPGALCRRVKHKKFKSKRLEQVGTE